MTQSKSLQQVMTADIRRAEFENDRRILMISDLHGHADGLMDLLKTAAFCENDILVIVGDYVEKGPQSLKTLRCVMQLCEHGNVFPLMGNVDLWRLQGLLSDEPAIQQKLVQFALYACDWWPDTLLHEICRECGIMLNEQIDTQKVFPVLRKRFAKEIAFLQGLPTVLETQRFIFVHGGIPHDRLNELKGTPAHLLMKRDRFMDEGRSFAKYVAVGHWPVALYGSSFPCNNPIIDRQRRILSLDGGCGVKADGQLNLVSVPDWRSEEFTVYTWSPLPVITALDAQEGSADSGFIHWGDNEVEVTEYRGEAAVIRHHGRRMTVPADLLRNQDGKILCDDFTDHRLQIAPGDRLHLIRTSFLGAYVKKNGCTGWYTGRYDRADEGH